MQDLNRRRFVLRAASVLAAVPLSALGGCSDPDGEDTVSGGGSSSGGTEGSTTDCCDETSASTGASSSVSGTSTGTTSGTTTGSSTSSPTSTTTATATTTGESESSGDPGESSTETSTGVGVCETTPSDIEGPFYRPGIPVGGNLDVHGDNGVTLQLDGRVLGEDCEPIANAIVEIWHATPVAPGGEAGDVQATYDNSNEYRYYGQVATDGTGAFSFTTLRPGWYLNGAAYRPAHIHLKVWVRDVERLTTQLYFEGDPFNEDDNWFNPEMALDPDRAGQASLDIVV